MARRGLQVVLAVLGTAAVVFGAQTVLTGGVLVPGGGRVTPSIDSELRFYAAWYVGAGILLLRAIPRVERESTTIRGISAIFFLAATARLLSILTVGRPHAVFVALMVTEFAIPVVLLPWQTAVARRAVDHGGMGIEPPGP